MTGTVSIYPSGDHALTEQRIYLHHTHTIVMPSFVYSNVISPLIPPLLGVAALMLIGLLGSRMAFSGLTLLFKKQAIPLPAQHRSQNPFTLPVLLLAAAWSMVFLVKAVFGLTVLYEPIMLLARLSSPLSVAWIGLRMGSYITVFFLHRAKTTPSPLDNMVVPLIGTSLQVIVWLTAGLMIAETVDFPLTSLLAGLGIGGLAIAMAAKETLANFFGSLTIIADRPFAIGDWIKVNTHEGIVEGMGFRSTKIRTFYNSLIYIPNAMLLTASVDNLGKRPSRRFTTHLELTYQTPPARLRQFCEGVKTIIRRHPTTQKEGFHVYTHQLGKNSIDILVYCFFTVSTWEDELTARESLLHDILTLAETTGISFAYPTQHLYLENVTSDPTPQAN